MSRRFWMIANGALVLATLLTGWFALNAPQVARPALNAYGVVSLSEDAPELPPAPSARRASDAAAALARRPLFSSNPGAAASNARPAPPPKPSGQPVFRTVLEQPTEPPKFFATRPPEQRVVNDPFRASLKPVKPRHEQYFGGHLIPPENRDTDANPPPAPDGKAPLQSLPPRINPSRAHDVASVQTPPAEAPAKPPENQAPANAAPENPAPENPAPENPAPENAAPVAAAPPDAAPQDAAPQDAAPQDARQAAVEPEPAPQNADAQQGADAAQSPELALEDMTLLGVFQSRGDGRALVRTAGGNVRVRPGDEIDGWRVAAIGEDSIRLRRGSQTRLLEMPKQ